MKPPYKYTKTTILLDAHKNSTTKLQKKKNILGSIVRVLTKKRNKLKRPKTT